MKFKGIAWDMDGTLANSEAIAMPVAVASAADYVQQTKPGTIIDQGTRDAFVQKTMGKTITEIGEYVGSAYGVKMPGDLQQRVTNYTIDLLAEKCEPVTGALETAKALQQAGLRQWIATSSAVPRVEATIKRTGLHALFPEQGKTWFSATITKPNPEVYERSIKANGLKPAEVISVEDSETGIMAARNVGRTSHDPEDKIGYVVGFIGGDHIPASRKEAHAQNLLAAGADVVIQDLREMPRLVARLNDGPQRPKAGMKPECDKVPRPA